MNTPFSSARSIVSFSERSTFTVVILTSGVLMKRMILMFGKLKLVGKLFNYSVLSFFGVHDLDHYCTFFVFALRTRYACV